MQRALAAVIGLASIAAAVAASAEPPAGAAACSGCHPASARVSSPVPRLAGLDRAAIAKAMQDFRSGQRTGHRHGPDRQGLHRRGDPGDRRLVCGTAMKAGRRAFLKLGVAATASAACFPAPIFAQGAAPRVVVIGGGFAGASCARALRQADPRIAVTLVEPNATFTACPFSNAVIAGLRELVRAAVHLRPRRRRRHRHRPNDRHRASTRRRGRSRSRTARACRTTGWSWRPASTSAGARCRATTRRRPRVCPMPGARASRPSCCAASSRPCRTAGSS